LNDEVSLSIGPETKVWLPSKCCLGLEIYFNSELLTEKTPQRKG